MHTSNDDCAEIPFPTQPETPNPFLLGTDLLVQRVGKHAPFFTQQPERYKHVTIYVRRVRQVNVLSAMGGKKNKTKK